MLNHEDLFGTKHYLPL